MDFEHKKRSFFNTAIADIYKAIDGGTYIGSFILTLCLIDQLAWMEFGYEEKGFVKWIDRRLLPQNIFYTGKGEELYSIRCGLVHSYGPSKKLLQNKLPGYELLYCNPEFHLQRINTHMLKVCLYSLLTETIFAAHYFFEEIKQSASSGQTSRMKQQLHILQNEPPDKYANMHRALASLDEPQSISVKYLQADYTSMILYPGVDT